MATYSTILTVRGKALVVAASVSGSLIPIVTAVVGYGGGTAVVPNENQTSLVRQVYSTTLNSIEVDPNDSSQYIAEFIIPASVGGFTIREIGLKTSDGDLFAVGNTPQVYKPSASEGAFSDTSVKIYFKVSNAGTVQVIVDPNVAVATRQWVVNYVSPANIIPGGLTNQFLSKKSNADGDFVWVDPTQGVQVIVDTVEEKQTLAAGQTAVILSHVTTNAAAVYIEGVRLAKTAWTKVDDTHLTLGQSYPDGTEIVIVQNEQTGETDVLRSANNLSDVADTATARFNLGAAASARVIASGVGLTGGGNLAADRTLSVDFAASGSVSATQAVRADDVRLSDARAPLAHTHAASDIVSGSFGVPRGGTGLTTVQAGYFLSGNGTNPLNARSPAQVLSDIGAASASHTHNIGDVNGLQSALDGKVSKSGDTMTGALTVQSSITSNGIINCFAGAVGAQQIGYRLGWNNNISRWAHVIESDASYSIYSYDASGALIAKAMGMSSVGGATFNGPLQTNSNSTSALVINNGGNLRIVGGGYSKYLRTNPSNGWLEFVNSSYSVVIGYMTDDGAIVANGGFQNSDRRLKTNIKPRSVLRGIALKIARAFSEWDRIADGKHDVGLVAQVLERIAPWYVMRGGDKRRMRAIDKAGIALECSMDNALAVEEYRKVIRDLTRRIEKLERRAK